MGNASVSTTGALGQGVYNYNLTLTGSGAGEIDGLIETGSGSVTKNGSGLWVLGNQNNNYTGGTRVNGGTLQTIQQDALGPGGLTINGGTVDLSGAKPDRRHAEWLGRRNSHQQRLRRKPHRLW